MIYAFLAPVKPVAWNTIPFPLPSHKSTIATSELIFGCLNKPEHAEAPPQAGFMLGQVSSRTANVEIH
jgi:hypothetical protein